MLTTAVRPLISWVSRFWGSVLRIRGRWASGGLERGLLIDPGEIAAYDGDRVRHGD